MVKPNNHHHPDRSAGLIRLWMIHVMPWQRSAAESHWSPFRSYLGPCWPPILWLQHLHYALRASICSPAVSKCTSIHEPWSIVDDADADDAENEKAWLYQLVAPSARPAGVIPFVGNYIYLHPNNDHCVAMLIYVFILYIELYILCHTPIAKPSFWKLQMQRVIMHAFRCSLSYLADEFCETDVLLFSIYHWYR